MKIIKNKTYFSLTADGESFACNEADLSIIINGIEHKLDPDVFNFILCLEAERDYYLKKDLGFFEGMQ